MADPETKEDLLKMKMTDIKKFVKKNSILTGYTNMRKSVLIDEILISKYWRDREKQKQEVKQVKQEIKPISEEGGEAVEKKKPKKIVDTYYNKEIVDDYYSIVGKSLIPYERSDMKIPIDKYYRNIEKEMEREMASGKKIVLQEDPKGVIKLTGKVKKGVDKPEQKTVMTEVEQKPVVPKSAVVVQKPSEIDIQRMVKEKGLVPKQIKGSEIVLPTAKIATPMASPSSSSSSSSGIKDILTSEQYVRVIRNVRTEFNEFKNKLDGMLSLF